MTKELEGLADELLGTKPDAEKPTNTSATESNQSAVKKPEPARKEYITHSMVSDSYQKLIQYLKNEIEVSPTVKRLVDEYIANLVKARINEVEKTGIHWKPSYIPPWTIDWQDSTDRVVKAIATELSFSNRLAAIKDMISQLDSTELQGFQGNGGRIVLY